MAPSVYIKQKWSCDCKVQDKLSGHPLLLSTYTGEPSKPLICFNEAFCILIKRNYVWSVKLVGLEVFGFETTWYGRTPRFAPALSFLDLKEKPKSMLIFFLAVYNSVMILLSPAPLRGAFSLMQLFYADIRKTLIPLEKKKLVKDHCVPVWLVTTLPLLYPGGAIKSSLQSMDFLAILSRREIAVCYFMCVYLCLD